MDIFKITFLGTNQTIKARSPDIISNGNLMLLVMYCYQTMITPNDADVDLCAWVGVALYFADERVEKRHYQVDERHDHRQKQSRCLCP